VGFDVSGLADQPHGAGGLRVSRVAVVTGGGSGIGEATCHELGRRGLKVAVLDVNEQAAQRVTDELRANGVASLGAGADVTDRAAVDHAFDKVRSELGPVSVLVTSAGLFGYSAFLEITAQDWARIIDVNLTGTFHCCQAALPDMVAANWGRIVMISSSSAQRGSPFAAHYAASKGAVITLTKSLAREYAKQGITVNTIPPSGIETPMQHQGQAAGYLPSNEQIASNIPVGYLGTGADIAAAVGFLSSDEARFITGQVVGVNGGSVL
jgi:2-hydroxycyclohexanecarboxyl-CoA dehydrogenase